MSSSRKKKPLLPEGALDAPVSEAPVEAVGKLAVMPKIQDPAILVRVFRDEEGRLVLEQENKPKRIAGSDDAFIEVARQFADSIVKERQI